MSGLRTESIVLIVMKMMCKKIRFKTEIDAEIALYETSRRRDWFNKWKRQECRHYFCNKCKGWHLTSKKEKNND